MGEQTSGGKRPPTIYLAGPDVFLRDALAMGDRKKALCRDHGFEGVFPFDNAIDAAHFPGTVDAEIYRANMRFIGEADFGIFNLTPFRGPSADVGTVFELGTFVGLGKPVFAYSNVADDFLTRVREAGATRFDESTGTWRDLSDLEIEDFGNADNLMIDRCLADQGRRFHRQAVPLAERFSNLDGFVACLAEARGVAQALGLI